MHALCEVVSFALSRGPHTCSISRPSHSPLTTRTTQVDVGSSVHSWEKKNFVYGKTASSSDKLLPGSSFGESSRVESSGLAWPRGLAFALRTPRQRALPVLPLNSCLTTPRPSPHTLH